MWHRVHVDRATWESGSKAVLANEVLFAGVSGNSRSHPFPWKKASDSCSRIMGMDFVIPLVFPNFGNAFFSFPSRSRILGKDFFIPFPFPNFGNGFFPFPSRSRIEGMGFFNSLPVPELREWNYPFPFPFPNSQMSFPLTPDISIIENWTSTRTKLKLR